jgi:hypothetical protein
VFKSHPVSVPEGKCTRRASHAVMALGSPLDCETIIAQSGAELNTILGAQPLGANASTFMWSLPAEHVASCVSDLRALVEQQALSLVHPPLMQAPIFLQRSLELTAEMARICPDANSQFSHEACVLGGHNGGIP